MDFGTIMLFVLTVWAVCLMLVIATSLVVETKWFCFLTKNKVVWRSYLIYCNIISLIVLLPVAMLEGGIRSVRSTYLDMKSEFKREWYR